MLLWYLGMLTVSMMQCYLLHAGVRLDPLCLLLDTSPQQAPSIVPNPTDELDSSCAEPEHILKTGMCVQSSTHESTKMLIGHASLSVPNQFWQFLFKKR